MSRRARVAVVVLAGAALAGAGYFAARRTGAARTDVPVAARPSFSHAFTVGRKLTYDVDYRSEALVDSTLQRSPRGESERRADGVLSLSSTIGGTLTMTVAARRDDGSARVLATLSDLEVSIVLGDRVTPLPDETFLPLARGFFVDYGADGSVPGIAVEDGTHPVAARLASQIVAFLQLEAPPGHGEHWQTDEKDPLGDLHARYTLLDDPPSQDGGQLIQKVASRQIAARSSGALSRLIAAGNTSGTSTLAYEVLPREGILYEAAGALTTEQMIGDLQVGSDDTTIVVRLTGDERSDLARLRASVDERASVLGELRPLDPSDLRALERHRENEALVARIDLAAVVTDARAHPPPPQSRDAASYARILSAAIDVSPEGRALLERAMLDPVIGEDAFAPLARAFGEDGSPASQAALVRVVDGRPKKDPGREVALFALGRADAPTDRTVSFLEALSKSDDHEAYAALLAFGRVAGQLAATDASRGSPVLARLLARVDAAADDDKRAQALEALGNAATPSAEPTLARWSEPAVPTSVRRSAISAYRLVPSKSARDALVRALGTDPAAAVRSAALEAILLRKPDDGIADAVADRLEHDPEESVKKPAASRLISLCRRSERACSHIERLQKTGDDWTRHELASFRRP